MYYVLGKLNTAFEKMSEISVFLLVCPSSFVSSKYSHHKSERAETLTIDLCMLNLCYGLNVLEIQCRSKVMEF